MALDSTFFDSISFELEKRKYYNADRVNSVMWSIRRQAAELNDENSALKARIAELEARSGDVAEALISAKAAADDVVGKARAEAERIIADAEDQRKAILSDADREAADIISASELSEDEQREMYMRKSLQLQELIGRVEGIYSRMREQYSAMLEAANRDWQEFLCELPDELLDELSPEALSGSIAPAPSDLEGKVKSIADLMDSD